MVSGTIKRLQELKEHPATSTRFKDHLKVFTETSQSSLQDVSVSEAFLSRIYRPYIQSVIDHISSRMESSDIFSAFSIFDPIHLTDSEESLSTYGMEKLRTLTDFYGKEQTLSFEGNAGVFQSQMLILTKQKQNGKSLVGFFSPSIDLNQGFRR